MDIVSLGLSPNSSRSKKILRVVNSNNRISIAISKQFETLNAFTKTFLAIQYQQQQQVEGTAQKQPEGNEQLQEIFKDLFLLLDVESFSLEKVTNINLEKLKDIQSRLYGVTPHGKNDETIVTLINEYTILALSLNLSNSLIYKTLILKNQQVYWETIYNSRFNKLVYFVQTSPIKLYHFAIEMIQRTNRAVSSSFHQVSEKPGVEEDNQVYGTWLRINHFARTMTKSVFQAIETIFVEDNPAIAFLSKRDASIVSSLKWYITSIVKAPITITNREIKTKLRAIKNEIELNTGNIDKLIKGNVENLLPTLTAILGIDKDGKNQILQAADSIIKFDKKQYSATSQSSFLTRYWPLLLVVLIYAPSQSQSMYKNRDEILHWIQYNGIEPVKGFFVNWVIKPLNEMLNILRSDSDGITITTKDSLRSDVDSLEKMILEFAHDNHIDTTPQIVASDVQNGDLNIVMSRYEQEIRSPIKYIISGSLLRLVLIQMQKVKVDGAVAISGIDKLMKSQQLVFGIVSMSPSIIILYQIYSYLTSARPIMVNGKQLNIVCLKCLNNIENLLIMLRNDQIEEEQSGKDATAAERKQRQASERAEADSYEGELLIEIINLIISSEPIIPKELHKDWIRDLNELNNSTFGLDTKLALVNRVWNMYGSYFK
ncbi:uncharacterized protein LODBEIA_P35700 [Lodderomyces beijingensis]|uniref:Nuclear control of ATPase protein 2 n=1 Tax=Lodderomyces beijingensis TaxID=1775926 RepID=A0ABP0ZQZ8_9ASCO